MDLIIILRGGLILKKIIVLVVLIFGFAFLYKTNTEAKTYTHEEVISIVEEANNRIDDEIVKAIEKEASLKQDHKYDEKLDKIIEILIFKTDKIAEKTIKKLEKINVEAECEYQVVIIGERIIYVDPIRVHRW